MDGLEFDGPAYRKLRQMAGIPLRDIHREVHTKVGRWSYRHLQQAETDKRKISPECTWALANALTELTGRPLSVEDFTRPTVRRSPGAAA